MMRKIMQILLGCLVTSIGVIILSHAQLATGGTAGLALNVAYILGIPFYVLFFVINLPFYVFSWLKMGARFTITTLLAVSTLSLMTGVDQWLPAFEIPPVTGAVFGGMFIGIGVTLLFINNASLGGFTIIALYLKKARGMNPGKVNFIFDCSVVVMTVVSLGFTTGLFTCLSIVMTSLVISYFRNQIATPRVPVMDSKETEPVA